MYSLVINADTRSGFRDTESSATAMFNGCRSLDFLIDGVENKKLFMTGFEFETILFVDEHETIPENVVAKIRNMVDTLIIRKHDKRFGDMKECQKFNDLNYLGALQLARGKYIIHFDQDTACFTRDETAIQYLTGLLSEYDYVSYPSIYSPVAVADPNYDYRWCSTRFFMCKRESLDFTEIQKCLLDSDYMYGKYPASCKNPWTEHVIGLLAKYNGKDVYYPQMQLDNYAVFSWNRYVAGTLSNLNKMTYDEVKKYIQDAGGIVYPNDVTALTKI